LSFYIHLLLLFSHFPIGLGSSSLGQRGKSQKTEGGSGVEAYACNPRYFKAEIGWIMD
jgi:hypothetical protein